MKKKKILIWGLILKIMILACITFVGGCTHKKPPLSPTQVIDGKSIVMPPEIDAIPQITEK